MKKNDLIKLLYNTPGNPDILIWNGFVDDFHHVHPLIEPVVLVKHSREFIRSVAQGNGQALTDAELDQAFRAESWGLPNPYVSPEYFGRWYGKHRKKALLLQCKRRGKVDFDRLGTIEY